MSFILHPQLESDTLLIQDLPVSRLLLMNDSRIPWFILVPRKADVKEIHELEIKDQIQLLNEISSFSKWAQHYFKADKMNIAALGNIVPQLHIHIIARQKQDFAWPKPIWGMGSREPYSSTEAEQLIENVKANI